MTEERRQNDRRIRQIEDVNKELDRRVQQQERRYDVLASQVKDGFERNDKSHEQIRVKMDSINDVVNMAATDTKVIMDRGDYRRRLWTWMGGIVASIGALIASIKHEWFK